jgi:lipopolysaccharide export system permease protein
MVAPFLFGLAALTSLMLLSQIAKKFGALVGKGLPWSVIAEVFALSLPFIVAMTLPMAVLLAVLYAFSHLAADNEITAMRASGISVYQILGPVLAWGAAMSVVNFVFVDQVLPETNARLRTLLIDIGRKKPTLELREQVINEVPPSQYYLRAGRIDAATGRLKDITIYDMGGETSRRIIYADSGRMAYSEGRTDLNLRLFDGSIHQYRPSDPLSFQLTYYRINDIRVKDVYDELVRNSTETVRGDREMSTCEMLSVIQDARKDERNAVDDRETLLRADLRVLLHLPALPTPPPDTSTPRLPAYCGWIDRVQAVLTRTAEPPGPAQPATGQIAQAGATVTPEEMPAGPAHRPVPAAAAPTSGTMPRPAPSRGIASAAAAAGAGVRRLERPAQGIQIPAARPNLPKAPTGKPVPRVLPGAPPVTQGVKPGAQGVRLPAQGVPPRQGAVPAPRQGIGGRPIEPPRPGVNPKAPQQPGFPKPLIQRAQLSNWAQVATAGDRETEADRRADRFAVEVHKKWSISFACISFVIIGIVMALRFPRGGMGLVIGGGLLIFSIHYVGLTAGESLADRGLIRPWEAMWAPNIVLTVLGLIGLIRVSRESGSTRGGDFQEITDGIRHLLRRFRRRGPAPAEGR